MLIGVIEDQAASGAPAAPLAAHADAAARWHLPRNFRGNKDHLPINTLSERWNDFRVVPVVKEKFETQDSCLHHHDYNCNKVAPWPKILRGCWGVICDISADCKVVVGHGLVLKDKNITFIAPDRLDETNGGLGMTWKLPFDPGDPCRLGGPFEPATQPPGRGDT